MTAGAHRLCWRIASYFYHLLVKKCTSYASYESLRMKGGDESQPPQEDINMVIGGEFENALELLSGMRK